MEQIVLTKHEKINISTTEISKKIKAELKNKYPGCKFSIRTEYYSGGSSISIYLMKADRKIIKDFKDITEEQLFKMENYSNYSKQDIENNQGKNYHQLNHYTLKEEYNDNWCNGIYLTEQGHKLLSDVVRISDIYNYDESDSMIDYFSVNFYLHLSIGRWNKDFDRNIK